MKKILPAIILIFVLTLCVVVPLSAQADTATHTGQYTPSHGKYTLTTIVDNTTNNNPVGVAFSGYYFGASGIRVTVQLYSSPQLDLNFWIGDNLSGSMLQTREMLVQFFDEVDRYIVSIDACANTQYDGTREDASDIYRYNNAKQGQTVEISAETFEMLQIAREMYNDTDGAFNPAVYRLVDLWGFSSRIYSYGNFGLPYDRVVTGEYFAEHGYPLPEQKYIDAFSDGKFTDYSENAVTLTQQDGKYYVTKNVAPAVVDGVEYQQWLDLGGIAKGYAVDGIRQMLDQRNLERYYVDAGSSSSLYGLGYDGSEMTLNLTDPFDPSAMFLPKMLLGFYVGKSSVSSSGQYVRKYTTNGVEYSHIIDGLTGAPAQTGVKEVLVVIPQSEGLWAGKGDCLTTALTVMGRQKTVDFVNGYLKERNITIVVVYETMDGGKQILSNLDKKDIVNKGENFDEFQWSLVKQEDGTFVYDANATFVTQQDVYKTLVIVLASLLGVGVVAVVVYHLVKGRKNALSNVQNARRDKPFKITDIVVYLAVVLVIVVLFAVFFGEEKTSMQTVSVVDDQTGEQLFFCNVIRKEYKTNDGNSNGWKIEVNSLADGLEVTFSKEIDGETHFNKMKITYGTTPTVKMTDSLCGFHQDCVYAFGEVTTAGGAIVCSPNRLKILTE